MNLLKFNHWWNSGNINSKLVGRERNICQHIKKYVEERQIILLKGLRRVGKTTLLYQLIDYLINEVSIDKYRILYFSFDEDIQDIENILDEYSKNVLRTNLAENKDKIYVFFDEIQKLKNWTNQLKVFYDLYPEIKFFISGSESLEIIKGTKSVLAGRVFEFTINPLSFREFLKFKDIKIDYDRIDIFKDIIQIEINNYIKSSGFIEAIGYSEDEIFKKYFKESILERVIYRDIPEIFSVKQPGVLYKILMTLSYNPGMLVHYDNFGSDLSLDQRTIKNYFEFLKESFLIRPLYQFSTNLICSERKLKKYYLSYPCFAAVLNEEPFVKNNRGRLIENLFISLLKPDFFYRTSTGIEVDIIMVKGEEYIPIEVKFKEKILDTDMKGVKSFIKKFAPKKAIIISKEQEKFIKYNNTEIFFIPYWKFILDKNMV